MPENDAKKMRDEIRPKLEEDVKAAIKDAKARVKPPAAPGNGQGQPAVRAMCTACGGSGGCRVCGGGGLGCGYCHGGRCGSCNGHGVI